MRYLKIGSFFQEKTERIVEIFVCMTVALVDFQEVQPVHTLMGG